MKLPVLVIAGLVSAAALQPTGAHAWEPGTTHAGLTEQSVAASTLHARLTKQLGAELGLFTRLTIPPADAPALFSVLRSLNPVHGYVPDGRGRQRAVAWLVLGSAIADFPSKHAANHFFDPLTGKGLTDQTLRGSHRLVRGRLIPRLAGRSFPRRGMSAPDWIVSKNNPLGQQGFLDQYAKAVRARTPGERSRHLAAALIAAGAMLHVLQDMGSPSHARNDLADHLDQVGQSRLDVGSRMERVAAVAYGRLGVPAARTPIRAATLRGFFTAKNHSGLADHTTYRWFSAYTLPRPIAIHGRTSAAIEGLLARSIRRPRPAPLPQLDFVGASTKTGKRLTDGSTCVAEYRVRRGVLSWFLGDECMLEQLQVILPEVVAYGAGFVDYLFRGELFIARGGGALAIGARKIAVGKGTLEVFWDDDRGVRTRLGSYQVADGRADAILATSGLPPKNTRRVSALFVGVDKTGQPLVAVGSTTWPIKVPKRTH